MCDPAADELGRAQDEAIDLVESKSRIAAMVAAPPTTPFSQAVPQVPSVGRIVHYVAYGTPGGEFPVGKHRAAIITEVLTEGIAGTVLDVVHLNVINPTGYFFNLNVPFDPTGKTPGSWHWPERV